MNDALQLTNLDQSVQEIIEFITRTFRDQNISQAVIAVSGGIDSGLALTLLAQAIGSENVTPIFLPYGDQDMSDSKLMADFAGVPAENQLALNVQPIVDAAVEVRGGEDQIRKGNLMARARMMLVYDVAKEQSALVCGTENKSEKHLGYFTRFGDAAADLDPLQHLYKTQVQQLALHLGLPEQIIKKAPSAGLWPGQTDESELGFSYELADQVLFELIDHQKNAAEIMIEGVSQEQVQLVADRVAANQYKQQVPYVLK